MKVNFINDGIYEITDFVNKKDRESIMLFANSFTEEEWNQSDPNYTTEFWIGKERQVGHKVLYDAYDRIQKIFKSFHSITGLSSVCRHNHGQHMEEHFDNFFHDSDIQIAYGIVIYWNDNYQGGEIYYPDLNIIIKPKAGSLIMHKGDILHRTLPVTSNNTRYFSTCFVQKSIEVPAVFNNDIFNNEDK